MSRFLSIFLMVMTALLIAGGLDVTSAEAAAPPRSPIELVAAVEKRAGASDFGQLERFGDQAMTMQSREGLNRLYHVTWIFLNQGEFDTARKWNARLTASAQAQHDARYITIAHLNDLAIQYDDGDITVAPKLVSLAHSETDWFTRAHAGRLTALWMMDNDRIGEALKMLTEIDATIPERDPYAATAHAGIWEMAGIGLMKLNDFEGSATAFGRFEIDFNNPAYPRPDFDSLYNLARLAVQVGDQPLADRLAAAHHRLSQRTGLVSLMAYDASLCAYVAESRGSPQAVLDCMAPYGVDLGQAEFLAGRLLPLRAIASAQTGQIAAARRDLAEIRRREAAHVAREDITSEIPHVEAEILFAQGRSAQAYAMLRQYDRLARIRANQRFSAGIRQVTGDMQDQLDKRRQQLETARTNTTLQRDVIRSQNWIVGIAIAFFLSAGVAMAWQFKLSQRLSAARLRADAANTSKSEFLANMSHEIRTPLNGIVAMADTLSRAPLKDREHEMVEVIRSSGLTLERLLSDILDTAKIESGEVAIEAAPFNLGQAVRGVGMLWAERAEQKSVSLSVDVEAALDRVVVGDAVRVRQILTNLISNALKFTSDGGVSVRAQLMPQGLARFTVTDTGVGFDDEQKARIFKRFQQADGSITRQFGGTGLGLAISRDLAEMMGGTLDCRSRPGHGATFWLDLPLIFADVEILEDAAETVADAAAGAAGLRILLADDHPANRKVVEIMLADTDAILITVENGEEALAAFETEPFDLVLMDMQMPVMDGLTATRAIRSLEAAEGRQRTPVVMLTANALAEHVEQGRAAGADGHLAKPITLASLFGAIESALAGDAGEAGEAPDRKAA